MNYKQCYLSVMMLLAIFTLFACTSEDDLSVQGDFPDKSEATWDNTAQIIETDGLPFDYSEVFNNSKYQKWSNGGGDYRSILMCFYSLDEIKNSDYAPYINSLPTINWSKQTLVITRVFCAHVIGLNSCKVYHRAGKYVVDVNIADKLLNAIDDIGVIIVLNEKGVQSKSIKLEL